MIYLIDFYDIRLLAGEQVSAFKACSQRGEHVLQFAQKMENNLENISHKAFQDLLLK